MRIADVTQDGLITTSQLRSLGSGPQEIRALLRSGALRRVIRGWYAVRPPEDEAAPWVGADRHDTALREHRLLVTALLRAFGGRVCASHHSALVLHGVDLWRSDLGTAHVARVGDDHSRHRTRAVIHPDCGLDPVRTREGLATVPPAVAVVQVGLRPFKAGAAFPLESLVAADSALHGHVITHDDLDQAVALCEGHPGIQPVRELLRHATELHESVGETRLAHGLRVLGVDVVPQFPVLARGRGYRADFRVRQTRVLVEFDGLGKYLLAGEAARGDEKTAREALADEKRRQDALTEEGWELLRVTWRELDDLRALRSRLDAARARAAARHGPPTTDDHGSAA